MALNVDGMSEDEQAEFSGLADYALGDQGSGEQTDPPPEPEPEPEGESETSEGEAQDTGKAEGEDTKSEEPSYIEVGGKQYSMKQLETMAGSYDDMKGQLTDLSGLDPMMKVFKEKGFTNEEAVQFLSDAATHYAKSQRDGGKEANKGQDTKTGTGTSGKNVEGVDDAEFDEKMKKWERDNAMEFPDFMKDALKNASSGNKAVMDAIANQNKLLMQVLGSTDGFVKASEKANKEAQTKSRDTRMNQIKQNLETAQKEHNIPASAESAFGAFLESRGILPGDLVDPAFANQTVADFKAVISTKEMERLKNIAKKRQAFKAKGTSANPGSGLGRGAAGNVDPALGDAEEFAGLLDYGMKQRGRSA